MQYLPENTHTFSPVHNQGSEYYEDGPREKITIFPSTPKSTSHGNKAKIIWEVERDDGFDEELMDLVEVSDVLGFIECEILFERGLVNYIEIYLPHTK